MSSDKSGRVLQKITINHDTGAIEFGPFCPEGIPPEWTLESAMEAAEPLFRRGCVLGMTVAANGNFWSVCEGPLSHGYAETALGALLLAIEPKESPT